MKRILVDVEMEQAEHPSFRIDEGRDVVGRGGEKQAGGKHEGGDAVAVHLRQPLYAYAK